MRKTVGIVLAGARVEELSVLTEHRPKSAVVFGGVYRTIDFALTNLANADIGQVGILSQYRPASLMDHVDSGLAWDLVGAARGLRFLPPYLGSESDAWYRGPADALYQNLDFIERTVADDVIAVSGDHAYSMDYGPLLSFHKEKAADLTIAFTPVVGDASRFGIGEMNAAGEIVGFSEKPEYPRSNLASMSVYVFRRQVLVEELHKAVAGVNGAATFQIYEILKRMIPYRRAYGYVWHGDWGYVRTLDEYYQFHQSLLGSPPKIDLSQWGVRTNVMARRIAPPSPARYLPGCKVDNSLVANGCVIAGSVHNSILSPGVKIAADAKVTNSILWDNVIVESGAVLDGVIADKRAVFGAETLVGSGSANQANEELPESLSCGVSVIGMEVCIPAKTRIQKNVIIHYRVSQDEIAQEITAGKSVHAKVIQVGHVGGQA
ncbi:MAG: glucose-1-phosphate adenylyltransferase [Deltaproteobacteria bacterium]|nr:glucose-1-phosphate adenylyltransferase [Deltaproteobacteria bacterium]